MAMRVALGASRRRVLRQMLTESLLLSLGAGALGLVLTFGTIKGLVHLCPSDIPRLQETSLDPTVLGFTLGLSVLTGLLFGMMPAWRASDVSVGETLKEGAGRTTAGRRWRRLHSGLVVSQIGLSLTLLIGAALLIRSLIALESMDLGFQPENVLAMHVELPEAKYTGGARRNAFFRSLLERLRAVPGVRSAAAYVHGTEISDVLISNDVLDYDFFIPGQADSRRPTVPASWLLRRTTLPPWASGFSGDRRCPRAARTLSSSTRLLPESVFQMPILSAKAWPSVVMIGPRIGSWASSPQ